MFKEKKKNTLSGIWGDGLGLEDKLLAVQEWEPEFCLPPPT